jgi:hypothetical protein
MYLKNTIKRVKVIIKILAKERALKQKIDSIKFAEESIIHLLVEGNNQIETIELLESVVNKVEISLSKAREEYLKQVRAIEIYLK